jgi:SnoaL-like domain
MEDIMKRYLCALVAIVALCITSPARAASTEENPADLFALHNVEIVFHQAASTKDLDLMMSLFADGATLSVGGKTYTGKDQVRSYFATIAGSFQPQNKWVAYTPAQRIRININGDQAHLYFECLYVDVVGKQIAAHTFSDDNLVRVGDKWLIKEMKAGPVPEL